LLSVVVCTLAKGLVDINTRALVIWKCQGTAIHHHGVLYFTNRTFNRLLIQQTCFPTETEHRNFSRKSAVCSNFPLYNGFNADVVKQYYLSISRHSLSINTGMIT